MEEYQIGKGDEVLGYGLTSSITVLSESGVRDTANLLQRERSIGVLYEAIKLIVEPLENCELR